VAASALSTSSAKANAKRIKDNHFSIMFEFEWPLEQDCFYTKGQNASWLREEAPMDHEFNDTCVMQFKKPS